LGADALPHALDDEAHHLVEVEAAVDRFSDVEKRPHLPMLAARGFASVTHAPGPATHEGEKRGRSAKPQHGETQVPLGHRTLCRVFRKTAASSTSSRGKCRTWPNIGSGFRSATGAADRLVRPEIAC